jgi:hypothetical protein
MRKAVSKKKCAFMDLFPFEAHGDLPFGGTLSAASEMTILAIQEPPTPSLFVSADSRLPFLLDYTL